MPKAALPSQSVARVSSVKRKKPRGRHGDGTVYPEAGKWVAVVSKGSGTNRRRKKERFDTEVEAHTWRRKMLGTEVASRRSSDTTVRAFLESWLDDVVRPGLREKTYKTYGYILSSHVYPALGSQRLDRVKHDDLRRFFADLEHSTGARKKRKEPISLRTREVVYLRLRSAFAYAFEHKMITENPMLGIGKPKPGRRPLDVWTVEEARAFLDAMADDELACLYRLALSIGPRRGELLALRWVDVDLKGRQIHIRHTLTDDGRLAEPKTSGSRRPIDLPSKAGEALKDQRERLMAAGLRASPWVFPVVGEDDPRRGECRLSRAVSRAFQQAVKRAKLRRIRFHDLRHTAATLRLVNGDHPKIVQEMLGHASIQITLDTYSAYLPSLGREAADRFDAVL